MNAYINQYVTSGISVVIKSMGVVGNYTNAVITGIAPFTPPSSSDLMGWWKSDSLLGTTNSSSVGSGPLIWQDSSAQFNHLTQSITSLQPIYTASIVGNLPAIRFTSTQNLGMTNEFSRSIEDPFTIITVGRVHSDSLYFGSWNSNNQFRRNSSGANNISKYFISSNADQISDDFSASIFTTVMSTWTRRSGSTVGTFYENTSSRNGFLDQGFFNLNWVGGTSYALQGFNGDMFEMFIYRVELTLSDITAIYNYAQSKWGV
jgi:hypothetical protein